MSSLTADGFVEVLTEVVRVLVDMQSEVRVERFSDTTERGK